MIYQRDHVTTENSVISLRFVESIEVPAEESEIIVDLLKDDLNLILNMASGARHVVSMSALQSTQPAYQSFDKSELRIAIIEKWVHLLGK